jgi:hypothetical protein
MDHDEAVEQLELAAVEPGGLDRLMAGDTAMAAAVVGHLAGCESCSEELRRLSRAAPLLRDLVRTTPPTDLRDRTLAFVRERGRPRGESAVAPAAYGATVPVAVGPGRRSRLPAWAAAIAAVVVVAAGAAGFMAGRADTDRLGTAVRALEAVTRTALDISDDPGARRVELASTGGGPTTGSLLFSPSTTRLVVVASDLPLPPSGMEYRCWLEIEGQRYDVGRMFFADELAFWVGDTPEVSDLPDGTTFGVSLTDVGSAALGADPVIVGKL